MGDWTMIILKIHKVDRSKLRPLSNIGKATISYFDGFNPTHKNGKFRGMVDPIALPILLQFSRFLFIHVLFFRIGNMHKKWVGFLASRSLRWSQLWMISTSAQKQPLFSISEDLRWSFRLIYPIDLSIDPSIYLPISIVAWLHWTPSALRSRSHRPDFERHETWHLAAQPQHAHGVMAKNLVGC